jgi:enterochelin esterase family protein
MKQTFLLLAWLLSTSVGWAQERSGKTGDPGEAVKRLQAGLASTAEHMDSAALERDVYRLFGREKLQQGKAGVRVEGTTAVWGIIHREPARVVRANGTLVGEMIPIGQTGLQALAMELPNMTALNYRIEAGSVTHVAGVLRVETVEYPAESKANPDTPKGRLEKFLFENSQVFPGTLRTVTVYVPAQYQAGQEAALMIWQDGTRHADPVGSLRVPVVLDNLIHSGAMPVTIGVFIDPGRSPKQKEGDKAFNRSKEYDSLGPDYARFLLEEILPEVEKRYALKFRTDPGSRAIAGGSSGGICAFTAAWERPDQFGKVLSWVGSFVDLRGGHVYPSLVRLSEPKPVRVYLMDGTNDLDNAAGNWPLANRQMEAALKYSGWDYRMDWTECFHGSKGMISRLPEALRWLWRP